MTYKEVKQELRKEFDSIFKSLGYKAKNGLQGCTFSIIKSNAHYSIGYSVTNYIDEFYANCSVGIGIIPIDIIMWYILEGYKSTNTYGTTIGSTIARYFNETNYRYHIKSVNDIKEWGKIVKKFYEEYAVPFFEKYNTVAIIDSLFNEKPTERVIYMDDLGWHIIIGLIAAKLNNNPKYDKLRDYYKSEVESKFQGYFMYEKCMKVIDFLDKYTSEELNKLAEK
jgi:hypothetical protein